MFEKLKRIWKIKDLRNNILFVLAMLLIFRLVAHIPIPGINTDELAKFLNSNQIFGLMNIFSGGTMKNFSVVMLGVAPYITASIIFQLLTMVVPSLEELSKEGESGQQKINMYTRWVTVPLALLQSFGMIKLLSRSQYNIMGDLTTFKMIVIMITITAGTIFLMWLGELITEKNIGNGISLLIFAGIVASLPSAVKNIIANYYGSSEMYNVVYFLVLAIVTIIGVVIITEGQRNVPVTYAKQVRGSRVYGGSQSHLPLRVNMAGVIPIIFAISVLTFPTMISQLFINSGGWLGVFAQKTIEFFSNQLVYGLSYFILVFGFTYFYTAVIFQPDKMAENLQRQGAFIPGIRPGTQTRDYLQKTVNRLLLPGALFLSLIAVLPLIVRAFTHTQSLAIGGTSLLIVVSVAIETTKQIEAQLTMHEYDHV